MQASKLSSYEKYAAPPPPAAFHGVQPPPSSFGDHDSSTTTGIPLSTATTTTTTGSQYYYTEDRPKTQIPWSSGLCDCFSDCENCCMTFWCPCVTFGRIAEIVDKGSSSCGVNGALYTLIACVTGCACCYSCFYRSKMRQQHALEESPCGDCLVHCCCEYCALCQEYRELQSRGYDMTIGWHGNVEKRNRGLEMASAAPVVEDGMSR